MTLDELQQIKKIIVCYWRKRAEQRKPLSDEEIKAEFAKMYPRDIGILELAENNRDYAVEAIGARHHWRAFLAGARAIEAAHGIKEQP